MKSLGLRGRLTLALAFLMAVTVFLMTLVVPPLFERQVARDHAAQAGAVTRAVAAALPHVASQEALLARLREMVPEFSFSVAPSPARVEADVRELPDALELTRVVRLSSGAQATLRVVAPVSRARETVEQSGRLLLFYVVLNSVVLFLFGALWLVRAVVRPLESLARTTEKLAAGEIDGLPPFAATNEIQRLHAATEALVTSLKARREKLIDAERLAAVGAFASGIAHEVGNPLAAVMGYVEILERGPRSEPERAELLSRSQDELRRIDRFLRDLLEYARPRQVAIAPVDVVAIVTDALRLFEGQPRASGVEIVREFSQAHHAMAEAEPLREVVVNLVSNGLDALAGVEGQRRVTVRVAPVGTAPVGTAPASTAPASTAPASTAPAGAGPVVIEVHDNGPGIPAEIRARIFEPFFSTKGPRKGTGLGLAIVKANVVAWGGRIEVDAAPGGGARVRVFLNAAPIGVAIHAVR
jgi:signal transduction histidine kinase